MLKGIKMDKVITTIFMVIFAIIFKTNAYEERNLTNRTVCNNTILKNNTDCWCMGNSSIRCILRDNLGMKWNLEALINISYTDMETMVFVLNNSWLGRFPVIEYFDLELDLLEHFTELLYLYIIPSIFQTHSVPLTYKKSTFKGCSKIRELHINIPLMDTDLYHMIKPLEHLEVLDFNNVRGISYKKMNHTVQALTKNIRKLWMSHFQTIGQTGYLTVLITAQFLVGKFEKLKEIDLSNNGFALVYTGWFNVTPNLEFLDMSHNGLTYSTNTPFLIEALMHPSIKVLNISHQGFYDPLNRGSTLNFIYEPKSHELVPDIQTPINVEPRKQSLGGLSNETVGCLNNMTHGNITRLFGNDTRVFCDAIRNCTFPSWEYFPCEILPPLDDLIDSDCEMWLKVPLGKNLEEFYFANNYLDPMAHVGIVLKGRVCFVDSQLRKLDFSNNYFWANSAKIAESLSRITNVTGLCNLTELNLADNDFHLNMTAASVNFPNLNKMNMARNFAEIAPGVSLCANKTIHSLKELDISSNNLTKDMWLVIKNCTNLVNLSLARNHLTSTLFVNLEGTHRLERIDLSTNDIQTLSETFQKELDRVGEVTINISNNPLICGCSKESLSFIKWVDSEHRKTKLADEDKLLCVGTNGFRSLSTVSYAELWKECSYFIPIVASIASSLGAVCAVAIIVTVIRLRFRIKYKLFTFQQLVSYKMGKASDGGNETRYEFDAFVSYSSEDRFWVHDVLMKTLEEKYGFKLVIHYRDIPLGANVHRAIDDRMSKSREYILVFTENFMESEWCQLEMEEAYKESLRRRKHLAVIVLGDIPKKIDHPTAAKILDEHNYLQWEQREKEKNKKEEKETFHRRKLFWAKLVHHLHGNSGSSCCYCCCAIGPSAVGYREVRDFAGNDNENETLVQVPVQNYGSISESNNSIN